VGRRAMRVRAAAVVAGLALGLGLEVAADCPQVDVREGDLQRYTERTDGNRVWCEGRYAESTSGGMTAVGFGRGSLVERDGDALVVHWPPVDQPTTLRIRSRRSRDYYLLDAEARPKEEGFRWPAKVAQEVGIAEQDLVVARRAEREGHDALLPVGAASEQPLRVAFLSAVGFEGITAELFRAGSDEPEPWPDRRDLGPVPANQLFRIALPEGLAPGLYRLKVVGQTRTRPVPTIEHLWVP
jgi:hypothetical protein